MKYFIYFLITWTLVLSSFIGCETKKKSHAKARYNSGTGNYPSSSAPLAECNRIDFGHINLYGQVGTYYEPYTNQYHADKVLINLDSVPADIFVDSNMFIQFTRWYVVNGQKAINTIPTRFYFVDKLTGNKTPVSTSDRISKDTLLAAMQAFDSAWINVTLSQFFERTSLLILGVDMSFTGLTVSLYNHSQSSRAIGEGDFLIPPFTANPSTYMNEIPEPLLYNLHPYISQANSYSTDQDYLFMDEQLCQALADIGDRIPSSVDIKGSIFSKIWSRIVMSLESVFYF